MALKIRPVVASGCLLLSAISLARAQEVESPQARYQGFLKSAETIQVLDEAAAGVSVDPYTGAMSIRQTDLSVPGTGLPIAITRTFQAGGTRMLIEHAFGDWELELPYLSGVFGSGTNGGWTIDGPSPTQRCSGPSTDEFLPRVVTGGGTSNYGWDPSEYFGGYDFHLPTGGSTPLLRYQNSDTFRPTQGGPYGWTANGGWSFGCATSLVFGGLGEGFAGLSPEGVRYVFDVMVSRAHTSLKTNYTALKADDYETADPAYSAWLRRIEQGRARINGGDGGSGSTETPTLQPAGDVVLRRREFRLLPSLAEDRFGNWVRYVYDAGRLIQIQASDGRQITLTRNADGKVTAASDGQRTITYQYTRSAKTLQDDGYSLSGVTLPDNSGWAFSLSGLAWAVTGDQSKRNDSFGCTEDWLLPLSSLSGSIISPAGGVYSYLLQSRLNGLVYTARACGSKPYSVSGTPQPTLSVQTKSVSGPGLVGGTWTYSYNEGSSKTAPVPVGTTQIEKQVSMLAPDGSSTQFVYRTMVGVSFQDTRPIRQSVIQSGSALSVVETRALTSASGQTYLASIGLEPLERVGSRSVVYPLPVVQQTTTQQGAMFTWQVNNSNGVYSFDRFANPLSVTRSSSGLIGGPGMPTGYSRIEQTAYVHDLNNWVLSQVGSVTCIGGTDCGVGKTLSRIEYDANSLPWKTYSFGVLQQILTYDLLVPEAKGSLRTITDGRGNVTTVSNWKAGIPQSIVYPALGAGGTPAESAVVNPIGTIASTTNELGAKTCYGYDAIGRLNAITYPSEATANTCDTSAWAATSRSFVKVAAAEYGIPAGHWKQTLQTGSGRATTAYDAQWRPVLTLTEDTGIATSKSFVVTRYDSAGRAVFASYPVATLTSVNDVLKGVTTSYDALGRVTQVQQDAEATQPLLTTTTAYLSGFRTQVTNPRGKATTTSYQAYDTPSTDAPVYLWLPQAVTTQIDRQPSLGKPLSVTRSGPYGGTLSATLNYVYDSNERLCKTVNPESGAALVDYDGAGNVAWSIDGSPLTGLICDRPSVLSGQTTRTYDALNRVTATVTPGNTANVTTTYYADGAINTLTAANPGGKNVTTTYTYNKRRLLTGESASNGATLLTLGYGYSANAHLSTLTYPDGQVVGYSPDALGRTTQVAVAGGQTYASGVTYYPTGAISGFNYGNGIVHTMTPNIRQLPARSFDSYGGTTFLDDTYAYDANGNVDYITDAMPVSATSHTRDLGYDDLDRLIVADSPDPVWGHATYSYDPIDNLRSVDITGGPVARDYRYNYDGSNRLTDIKNSTGTNVFAFGYDSQGNTTSKNGYTAAFDSANRLNAIPGVQTYRYDGLGRRVQTTDADGKTTFWMYSQSGQVLYSSEARRSQNISYVYLGNTQVATRSVAWGSGITNIRYQHTDALGSPVAETDASRTITDKNAYSPWGEAWGSTVVDGTGYTGHVMDQGTGLTYMQQRYYDPAIGRFFSVDPIATEENTGGKFNRYAYAQNNPYKFTDPDGRNEEMAYGAGVAIALRNSPDRLAVVRRAEAAAGRGDAVDGIDAGSGLVDAGKAIAGAGGVIAGVKAVWNVMTRDKPRQERYNRRSYGYRSSNPNAKAARAAGEGNACTNCGQTMVSGTATAPQAQHEPSLSEFHYDHGGAEMSSSDKKAYANSADALNGANCATCQRKEGAAQRAYVEKKEANN